MNLSDSVMTADLASFSSRARTRRAAATRLLMASRTACCWATRLRCSSGCFRAWCNCSWASFTAASASASRLRANPSSRRSSSVPCGDLLVLGDQHLGHPARLERVERGHAVLEVDGAEADDTSTVIAGRRRSAWWQWRSGPRPCG